MKKTLKLLILVLFVGLIFNTNQVVFGDDSVTNQEIKELNNQISNSKEKLEKLQEQQEKYSAEIKKKQQEQASLANQLAILENRYDKTQVEIESVELEMEQINLEIKKTNLEIESKNNEIEEEKEHIGSILKIMHEQGQVSTLEIMLLNDSLSDFLNQMKYLQNVNEEVAKSLESLEKYKEDLEKEKENLDEKNQELLALKEELENKKVALQSESSAKEYVIAQSKDSEQQYQTLLAKAKQEQDRAAADIASLEKAVRTKIANLEGKTLEFNDNGLVWPVTKNTITAYFHDPDYPFRNIFEHPAIDIRAAQGTPLKAAASGYVARVKISGTSYGYIMLVHGDGLSTVYGHASASYVNEDEYVVQGQTIGLSGGTPGTTGAGSLTTGPHLHFEVRLNGIPVNPLEYLP